MGRPMLLLLYCLERLVFVVLAPESRQFVVVAWLPKRLVWCVDVILAVHWLKEPTIDKYKMENNQNPRFQTKANEMDSNNT